MTHPESGTSSFTYENDGTLAVKTDQQGHKLVYECFPGSNGRLKLMKRLPVGGTEDACQRVTFHELGRALELPGFLPDAGLPNAGRSSDELVGKNCSGLNRIMK